jgi:hypothetical protein
MNFRTCGYLAACWLDIEDAFGNVLLVDAALNEPFIGTLFTEPH